MDDGTADLVACARRYRAALHGPEKNAAETQLVAAFRAAVVFTQKPHTGTGRVPVEHHQGLTWVRAFSSPSRLVRWLTLYGATPENVEGLHAVTGRALLDQYLRNLPLGTGIILDSASDHVVALPPRQGIVPTDIALDGGGMVRALAA